ncbi:MAG: hypothetical protein KBC15_02325 [Candidatus Levybacteria bacterium]|nr:hypothetical protein [Candidatus Levybacteria bacterium]
MSEFRKTPHTEIKPAYHAIVKNPEQRAAALELARTASVPLWEIAHMDVADQLTRHAEQHAQIVNAYILARENGDKTGERTHEQQLAHILQVADSHYGDKLSIVEEVQRGRQVGNQIIGYTSSD